VGTLGIITPAVTRGNQDKLTATVKSTHYAGDLGSPIIGVRPEGLIEFVEVARGRDADGRRTIRFQGRVIDPPDNTPVFAEITWREALPDGSGQE
jgi:hypothetical protein